MKLLTAFAGLLLVLASFSVQATTYYISSSGNDNNAGTSPQKAWASISKVNISRFVAGDSLLFEGGSTFAGGLVFNAETAGTPLQPIVISSYGKGWATINSGTIAALKAYNTAGFKIYRLVLKGAGREQNASSGIDFYMDLPATHLSFIRLDSLEIAGYKHFGILIGSWNGRSGFEDVSITNTMVHDNGEAGISTYAEAVLGHRNFYVANCKAFNNSGLPDRTDHHSGSGIVIGGVDGALVEYCEAFNNGWLNAWNGGGPVGIWGYHCNNLLIQYNESHHNRSGTSKDGGGFDIDGGCTNCTIQYNYSHDNDGPGYLIAQYPNAPAMKGVTIRYNISENDARQGNYGAIHLWSTGANGGIQDAHIYNNTVYVSPSPRGNPKAIFVQSGGVQSAYFRNNLLQVSGNLELVHVDKLTNLRFEGNNYWASGGSFRARWGADSYFSLANWREATGQESMPGTTTGFFLDPMLKNPGKGMTIADPHKLYTLQAYQLQPGSPIPGKGLDLQKLFGTNTGLQEFWGNSIQGRMDLCIGAHQPTKSSKACLEGGIIPLSFGQGGSGSYSGTGIVENQSFDPMLAGTGSHQLRYNFRDAAGKEQTIHHTITVLQAGSTEWLGQQTKSNDWFDSDNWSSCVPTTLINAKIPAPQSGESQQEPARVPKIKSGMLAQTRSMQNNSNTVVEIEGSATLEISGDYKGIEVETGEEATVVFKSNQPQLIPPGDYGKLVLGGKGHKELSGPVRVSRELQLGLSNLYLKDHSLTVGSEGSISNASPDGYIITDGQGSLVYEAVGGEEKAYYPVGTLSSFLPATIMNVGAPDAYSVRVEAGVLQQGTEGVKVEEEVVNNTWHLEEKEKGGSQVKLWLQWTAVDELPLFIRSNAYISHYERGHWSQPDKYASYVEAAAVNGYHQLNLENITSFSPFAIFNRNSILPVTLSFFSAKVQDDLALLSWGTAAENNSKGFYVEVSEDGTSYRAIGFVASKSENSNQALAYSYKDAEAGKQGTRYYRLRQVDRDGTVSYSRVESISFTGKKSQPKAYPNPFSRYFNLEITANTQEPLKLMIRDTMGRVVLEKSYQLRQGHNLLKVALEGEHPPGVYILTLYTSGGVQQQRLIKR